MPLGAKAPREQAAPPQGESPVYAFLENPSMIDYPGHLCAVFFISGCNFQCGFCHNASLMGQPHAGLTWSRLEEACRRFKAQWADSVCITGGEPSLSDRLPDLIRFFKRFGFRVKLDSNGSRPDRLRTCLPLVDYIAMDIKAGPSDYPSLTGFSDVDCLRESIRLIMDSGVDYEFRTTIIEPFHSDKQMKEIGEWIHGARRYCIQPFIPQETLPDPALRATRRTTPERLFEIEALVKPYVKQLLVRGA